jgi:outer membrane protein OmpA-like peptidoglycan-associated protein
MTDIFVVDIKKDGTYGKPRNLGKNVNTAGIETTPFLSEEGILYFSSDGHPGKGNLDVFAVEVFESSTSEAHQLAAPINSGNDDFAYIINKDKNLGFFTSNRLQGKDFNDLYSFTLEEKVQPEDCFISVDGKVKDKDTKNVISGATVELYDLDGYLLESISTFNDGSYKFKVSCAKEYKIVASNDNYITDEKRIEILEENYHDALHTNLNLSKIKEEKVAVERLQPIYYDYDDSTIKNAAAEEMDRIVKIMRDNPSLVLEASAFTDSRGSDSYNLDLSQRRLKSAIDYLTEKGVDITRVKGNAYGEDRLVNQCVNGVECDEHAHEMNRRTEFNFTVDEAKIKKTKSTKTERGVAKTKVKKQELEKPVKKTEIVASPPPETVNSKEEVQQVSNVEVAKPKAEPKAKPKQRSQNKAISYIEEQKDKIIKNLTSLENKYEEVIAKNSKLLDSAVVQKNRISEFKKSVKDQDKTGWSNIINYKIEVKNFNRVYQALVNENGQRTTLNRAQKHRKSNGNNENGTQKKTALKDSGNQEQQEKNLKVNDMEVVAIKVNSKGKYLPTRNPNKTDIIKVSFKVNRSPNVPSGEKDIYVVVQNPKGQVANAKGVFIDKKSNMEKKFTDHTQIKYDNKDVNVVFYLDKKSKDYLEGIYPIKLFLEGELVAVSNLTLENF